MSWSLSGILGNPEGFADVNNNLQQLSAIDRTNAGNNQCLQERDEQIDTANKITSVLLATEVFQNAEEISISMSGHANPEHKKSDQYGNENISINVSVRKYQGDA